MSSKQETGNVADCAVRAEQAETWTDQAVICTAQDETHVELERRIAELAARNEELLLSKQQLVLQSTALETASNAVVITDIKGNILWVNPAFTALTGYSAEEVIGKNPRLLKSGKHDQEFYKKLWDTILAGKTWRGSFTNRRKDGTLYHDEHTITPVRSDEGVITHFVAIMNDMTERRRTEEALQESEAKFRALFNAANDAIFVTHNNVFVDCNAQGLKVCGVTRDQLIGQSPARFSPPTQPDGQNSQEKANAIHERALAEGPQFFEWAHLRPDGTQVHSEISLTRFDLHGEPHFQSIVRDITERKRAEARIMEQASLLDNAREAIMVRDFEGKFLYWNKGAERMYGWTSQEALGRSVMELLHTDPKKFEEAKQLTISQGEWQGELEHITKDQRKIISEIRCTLICDHDGRPQSILSITSDITEKKKLEAQYMQAQRMESIGTLAGGIAHDFNNILGATLMHLGLLKQNPELTADIKESLKEIEEETLRATNLTRQLLMFSHPQMLRIRTLDMTKLVNDLLKMLRRLLNENIKINFQGSSDETWIDADLGMVEQVVMNLCLNARDAMPKGGSLTLATMLAEIEEGVARPHPDAHPGRFVCLSVTDTGCGMDKSVLERLFEPFFTTKDEGKGTGLGLATVYRIVKQHQGWVEVKSELGQGSSFRVYLPAGAKPPDVSAVADHEDEIKGGGETILIVEDNLPMRRVASLSLRQLGYAVLEAGDGVEALSVWQEHQEKIELLFTDMVMPGPMTGLDLAVRLKKEKNSLKIIISSGYSADLAESPLVAGQEIPCLQKPYQGRVLAKLVRRCLDKR